MQRNRIALIVALFLVVSAPTEAATPKAGSKCIKKNATVVSGSKLFTCVGSGAKLKWDKGVLIKQAKPSQTPASTSVSWSFDGRAWISKGNVPQCPEPLIAQDSLLDFSKVKSIVQPGQIRGGSYKPHAGLRWSEYGGTVKGVIISAPFDGEIIAAAHYFVEGNYQFLLNIVHTCGIMLRIGHLLEPSAFIKNALRSIPAAVENDSRESNLSGVFVKKGQVIASEVGMIAPASPDSLGTFMDLGIVDLRAKNPILNSNFKSNADIKYSLYSVCWYEGKYFADSDKAKILSLPFSNGDPTSDYCKPR